MIWLLLLWLFFAFLLYRLAGKLFDSAQDGSDE